MEERQEPKGNLEFKWLYPDEMQSNPENWREHPDYQTDALDALIFGEGGVGWAGVGLINNRKVENGWMEDEAVFTLVDGHDRQKIAQARGEAMPCLIGEWSPEEERTILTTFDPIGALAKTNTKALGSLLASVKSKEKNVQRLIELVTVKELRVKGEAVDDLLEKADEVKLSSGLMPNRIYDLRLGQLVPNDWSAHAMSDNEFRRLKQSIVSIGIVEPLIVRPLGDGKFEIVDGMQRYRAMSELDMETIPCLIRKYSEDEAKLASLAGNRLRGKFIPKRLAKILDDVRDTHGDELVTRTIGMEKKRMDSFGEAADYNFMVDEDTGVLERDYREYGPTDFTPLDEKLTLIIALQSEDFHLVEEILNEISPNWSVAILQMAQQWRNYVPEDEWQHTV